MGIAEQLKPRNAVFSFLRFAAERGLPSPGEGLPDRGNDAAGGPSGPARKRIIIADDDRSGAEVLRTILTLENFDVEVVHDGESAVRSHEARRPHLMILDVAMPVKDGLTACREIREKDGDVLILIVTAQKIQVNSIAGLGAGADGYLTKPVGAKEMVARVRSLLRRSTA